MVNITLSIPDELHKVVKQHPEIKWSEVARQAMLEYAQKLKMMDEITGKSELTDMGAEEIGNLIKKGIAERHKESL